MKAVILEGNAVNPGDLSWEPVTSLCETIIYENTTDAQKWDRLAGCEVVLTNKVVIDEAVFSRFPRIRYVGVCATGYNVVDIEAARRHGVIVTNIPAYSTDSVVQHTFALLLDLASRISIHDASVKNGDWGLSKSFCYWKTAPVELVGKTMGIYGFGNIGRGVCKVAEALGMKVLVYTKHPEKYTGYPYRFVSEDTLFRESDVLSFHCPLTPETENLVRKETIDKMKDGVFLLNVARGPVVDEADLTEALKSGKIAGAGVDVVSEEPMRPENPLLTAPNILITPHIAWASKEARVRLIEIAAGNLKGFLDGNPVNVVSVPVEIKAFTSHMFSDIL